MPTPSSTAWMRSLAGKFVVFDGPDGSGKSTQIREITRAVRDAGVAVSDVREPGGTIVSERIRDVLLDPSLSQMVVRCELMLYMASRAQLVAECIEPALQRGEFVLADRYVSSTLAYQGTAGGIAWDEIISVAHAACGTRFPPDLTIVFDVDQSTAATRLNPLLDRMEQKGATFHERVRQGYLEQARTWPDRYRIVDARKPPEHVTQQALDALRAHFATPAGVGR